AFSGTAVIATSDWDISATGGLTGITGITNNGAYTQSGASANTFTGASTFEGALTSTNTFTLGDGGETGAINTSAWDISTAGAISGVTTLGMSGVLTNSNATTSALSMTGATSGIAFSGTAVIATSDWDISATGGLTGITNITNNGAYTQSGASANTFTGASSFTGSVTASSVTATGIGLNAAQLRLAAGTNMTISSETSTALGAGVRISTNVYIVGFSSASMYYGDGSQLTNLAGSHSAVTVAAIGASANANGMTLTGQQLNLEPASASFGGVVTTGAQTFAGAKTFGSAIIGPTAGSTINSVLINAGAVSGVTSLAMGGALSGVTTLGVSGNVDATSFTISGGNLTSYYAP
ncbi:MAG: hypothetical protein Q7J84_16055, partial [Sulfuricaulis sp.]|nr:hypothetical protein [Sulfuricaulis sp.]